MEQLFAIRVLVHYYDKPKVDHAAVRRLVSAAAVHTLQLLLCDGTTVSLSSYIETPPADRKAISEIIDSSGSSLVQVASVFMLAEVRAAADALSTSPSELETACSALERLLGCLITTRPQLPTRSVNQAARVKLGTAARRRALCRISATSPQSDNKASILKAVNAVLRLCDVATHCLAVVSRQSIAPSPTCQTAVNLSTRLLTLAACLHEAQHVASNPALSFFSSNSLRTALVSGAMHLGAITIEHLDIEPMTWIHVANRIVINSDTSVPQRTSVMSALFGGMIKGGKAYETSERDLKAAERAVCLLSTLHVVLETDVSRDSRTRPRVVDPTGKLQNSSDGVVDAKDNSSIVSGTISQAARSFLGERVVAAEEDGDEGRIAARTVYQACEEYAERAGEIDGVMGLLFRFFASAGRQCQQENVEETIVPLSDTPLNVSCPPDESDASSDGVHDRTDAQPFTVDVFDHHLKEGFGAIAPATAAIEDVIEPAERLELHRQVGALSLDTLAHWIDRAHTLSRYKEFNVSEFCVRICRSASLFSFVESSSSYDLRSAMSDFGSLLGPIVEQRLSESREPEQKDKWVQLISNLTSNCQRLNPILSNVVSSCRNSDVITSVLESFLNLAKGADELQRNACAFQGLSTDSLLFMLLSAVTPDTALYIVETIIDYLRNNVLTNCRSVSSLSHRTASLILLSFAIFACLEVDGMIQITRQAIAGLYGTDSDSACSVVFPPNTRGLKQLPVRICTSSCNSSVTGRLFDVLRDTPELLETICENSQVLQIVSSSVRIRKEKRNDGQELDTSSMMCQRVGYHILWAFSMMQEALETLEHVSGRKFSSERKQSVRLGVSVPLSPFICPRIFHSSVVRDRLSRILEERRGPPAMVMYFAECITLLHIRERPSENACNLVLLLTSMVKSAVDILSVAVAEDVAGNYSDLRIAFRLDSADLPNLCVETDQSNSEVISFADRETSPSLSCLHLAMRYMHWVRAGHLPELLIHVVNTSTEVLDMMSSLQITAAKELIFEAMKIVLFLPTRFEKLTSAIFGFVERYALLASPSCKDVPGGSTDFIKFMARVCGLVGLIQRDSQSASGIQALCKFASDSSLDADVDTDSLAVSLCPGRFPEQYDLVSSWLKASLPRVCLKQLLSYLLVPMDESAVAVSSYSQSLSMLTEASERSDIWRLSVLNALYGLLLSEDDDFPERMVRRSVMQSATMNDGVVSLFERVVGTGPIGNAAQIMLKCFETSKTLFECENEANLESRVRLLNFVVRVAISHGRACVGRGETSSIPLLGPELFKFIFSSLGSTTGLLREQPRNEALKQIVLFLSGLIDCVQSGLYEDYQTVFDRSSIPEGGSTSTSSLCTSGDDVKQEADGVASQSVSDSVGSSSPYISEDTATSKLCTYTTTGDQYVEQHWYFCYSCDLAGSDGVCSVCARLCHQGCELAYSKFSRFFCDCGHGSDNRRETGSSVAPSSDDGEAANSNSQGALSQKSRSVQIKRRKPCVCLKGPKQDPKASTRFQALVTQRDATSAVQNERENLVGASLRKKLSSELEGMRAADASAEMKQSFNMVEKAFSDMLKEHQTAHCLLDVGLYLIQELDGSCVARHPDYPTLSVEQATTLAKEAFCAPSFQGSVALGKKLRSSKLLKSNSFDLLSCSSNSLVMFRGSILSYSPFHRIAAVATKSGAVEFVNVPEGLISSDPGAEKTMTTAFGRATINFAIREIRFHPENSNVLLVIGSENISVLYRILEEGSPTWKHLAVEVGLSEFDGFAGSNSLVHASWVVGELSHLLVASEYFVKIFDVAVDAFCPCFFATIPEELVSSDSSELCEETPEAMEDVKGQKTSDSKIVAACVVRDSCLSSHERHFSVLILISNGALLLSRTRSKDDTSPSFKFCFNVFPSEFLEDNIKATAMCYDSDHSTLLITFENGSALLLYVLNVVEDGDVRVRVRGAHLYKEAVPVGPTIDLYALPGALSKFLYFQKACSLTSGGVLTVAANQVLEINPFSGSPSSSVLGITPFAASSVLGDPSESGALLILDDGSLHRVHFSDEEPRMQSAGRSMFADIVDRHQRRVVRLAHGNSDPQDGYIPLPDPIGFFERSRLVSEHISFEGLDGDDDSVVNFERMGVILAGESGECVVSTKVNQPFEFSASISNKSLVLVGARLRVGGAERSRNRVPSEVRVFGRVGKSEGKNGVKRWLDIPFTVPESSKSPRRVAFQLIPRQSTPEVRPGTDGLVALDCLELHSVSDVEFAERKVAFDAEKSKFLAERSKKLRESALKNKFGGAWGTLKPNALSSGIALDGHRFSHEQAAALAIIVSTDKESFATSVEGGRLLSEVNSLWSAIFEGSSSRDPTFLCSLLQACLRLTSGITSLDTRSTSKDAYYGILPLLAKGSEMLTDEEISRVVRSGAFPYISSIEKCMFSVGCLARTLFSVGSLLKLSTSKWIDKFDCFMPKVETTITLLESHMNLNRAGRFTYKSLQRACVSAVDIAFLQCLKDSLDVERGIPTSSSGTRAMSIIVEMVCGFDQFVRLATGQRLLDLFDSVDGSTDFDGSPFEGNNVLQSMIEAVDMETLPAAEQPPALPKEVVEDADNGQSWAYKCDSCGEVCAKEWWHCNDCDDFDLCTACLRAWDSALDKPHKDHHLLLRGSLEDDVNDQTGGEVLQSIPDLVVATQRLVRGIVDEVLSQLSEGKSIEKWRFLDAAETVAQLLGPRSHPDLRVLRLESLFKSSFPFVLRQEIEALEIGIDSSTVPQESGGTLASRSSEALLLLLRILLCAKGSVMSLHIHGQGFPSLLLALLCKMHRKLLVMLRTGKAHVVEAPAVQNVMQEGVWNEKIPDLKYELMSNSHELSLPRTNFGLYYVADGIEERDSVFLNILLEVLLLLDYAYRSASSSAITAEMNAIPRHVLCDIINSCESASVHCDDSPLLMAVSAAASSFLKTLSLDDADALNNVLNKYLYEEQGKRLREMMSEIDGFEGLTSYKAYVDIADVLDSLYRAASKHPVTWRSFASENEQIVHDVYYAAKLFDGQVEVQVRGLQLLAAGLSLSSELASRAICGLAISEFDDVISTSSGKDDGSGQDSMTYRADKVVESGTMKSSWTIAELVAAGRDQQPLFEHILLHNDCEMVDYLIRKVMLKSQSNVARRAASQILVFALSRGASRGEDSVFVKAVNVALTNGVELMQFAGELADGLMHCLRFFINCCQGNCFGSASSTLLTTFTMKLMQLLKKRCAVLVSHPNARLYCRLSETLDLTGYYLESDPCMTCATATWEASGRRDSRLDMIRAETKYTDSSIMHRLVSSHEIHSVSVKVIDPRRSRRAKKIAVFYSTRSVSDAAELKNPEHPWKNLKALTLGPNSSESIVHLTVPVAIANIKLEFIEFHKFAEISAVVPVSDNQGTGSSSVTESNGSRRSGGIRSGENLQCPRCSRSVTDRHGICRNCHENAYQCRQCRNINYENLDGFLCNECGYCKHGRFEFSVNGRATHVAEPIRNEDDRKRASKTIEKETNSVHRCIEQLGRIRSSIIKSLNSDIPNDDSGHRTKLFPTSRIGIADLLDSVAPRSEIAVLEALLEGQVGQEIEEASHGTQGVSITEEVLAEGASSSEVQERELQTHRSGSNVASPVHRSNRSENAPKALPTEANFINRATMAIAATYAKECKTIFMSMSRGIRVLTMTRAELVRYANHVGGDRLRQVRGGFHHTDGDEEGTTPDESYRNLEDFSSKSIWSHPQTSCCYGCTQSFIAKCVQLVQTILKYDRPATRLIRTSTLAKDMLLVCSLCEKLDIRNNMRDVVTLLVNDNIHATQLVGDELACKIGFCIDSYETVDAHSVAQFEIAILESTAVLDDCCWEERLKLVIRILFKASTEALTCSSVAESIILPCLRVALRLTRSDSDLTVIETNSPVDHIGGATDNASNLGILKDPVENSETDNDDTESAVLAGHLGHDSADSDVPSRFRTLQSNLVGLFAYDGQDISGTHIVGHGPLNFRDLSRMDDRRAHQRVGSDVVPSSRAPSSIGTAFDVHMSDEEIEVQNDRGEENVNIELIQSALERQHDAKGLTANVGQWLEGKQSHASWISEMVERSREDEKDRSLASADGTSGLPSVKHIFSKWKCLIQRNRLNRGDGGHDQEPLSSMLSINKGNWIVRLMLFTPCTAVRKEACALLDLLCGHEEMLQLQLLDVLAGPALALGADVGEKSKEFFDLLESSLSSKNHRLYLIGKGFLPRVASLIRLKAERLIRSEVEAEASVGLVNFMEGYSLKRLVSLLRLTLEVIPSKRSSLREKVFERDDKIVKCLQQAYLYVRKLISLKTRLTDECATQLGEVLLSKDFLFAGSTVTAIVSACVGELKFANLGNDAQGVAILLDELCLMLCPERSEPTCLLTLNKAPTQEEFIRGNMSRNPYSSASFDGPLMRDVKNKICKDLDLPGLLEDDFAMELLVAGNVVKLDLPVMAVFEHVWRDGATAQISGAVQPGQFSRTFGLRRAPHAGSSSRGNGTSRGEAFRGTLLSIRRVNSEREGSEDGHRSDARVEPPMVVVYRLSGLDGEATEPIVDSLPVETNDDQNSEELYGDTIVLGRVGGFEILFQLLAVVGSWGDDAETAVRVPALRLLRASCEVSRNRTLLAKSPNAVSTLLDCAASAFEHAQGSLVAVASAESLLIAAEQILAQQRSEMDTQPSLHPDTVHVSSQDPEEVMTRVQVFLGRLVKATSPNAEYSILHLLPFLIQGMRHAIDSVLEHLSFSWDSIDYAGDDQRKAKQLGIVLLATPRDLRGNAFAAQTIRAGVAKNTVDYIVRKFPMPKKENLSVWDDALEEHGVPIVLKVLTGLSSFLGCGDEEAGDLLRSIILGRGDIIPILCQLEMAVSDNSVGSFAEELLEGLSRDGDISAHIEQEREEIKRARREAAQASRMAILEQTGLSAFSSEGRGMLVKKLSVTESASVGDGKKDKVGEIGDADTDADAEFLKMMEDLPDEIGSSCVVCGDGFRCRPEEALTFYVFCKKSPLELVSRVPDGTPPTNGESGASGSSMNRLDWEVWSPGRSRNNGSSGSRPGSSCCFASVTHMNAIHMSCHREAARVDRGSRRDEWDGAALRNSQTKCNNLFPVRPPVTLSEGSMEDVEVAKQANDSFTTSVEAYFNRLTAQGRTSLSQTKLVLYDLGRSLLRFSDGSTGVFSEHSKGGGPHSNASLIPHMVQLVIFLMEGNGGRLKDAADVVTLSSNGENGGSLTKQANLLTAQATLAKYLGENEVGDMTYYLASSVVLHGLSEWTNSICKFLRRGMKDAVLPRSQVYRLLAFADVVNRALKHGIVEEGSTGEQPSGKDWLHVFRRHIGLDESFPERFGDIVNERWEEYIRGLKSTDELVEAFQRNLTIAGCDGEGSETIAMVRKCLEEL